MEEKKYYDILGVSVKATAEEITAAKNQLAKRYHNTDAGNTGSLPRAFRSGTPG